MVSVRTAKAKGSCFEYDCQDSLKKLYPTIFRTSERGFQLQYDLEVPNGPVFECKRLKGISWNQLVKFYEKLCKVSKYKEIYLLFKSNRQPCLVFYNNNLQAIRSYTIKTFEDVFNVPFVKHESTRKRKKNEIQGFKPQRTEHIIY